MRATFGAPDLDDWSSPLPDLLREVTGLKPEPNGNHVRLDEHLGTRSLQRLALADVGGSAVVGLWPAELQAQARYLYADGRAQAMFTAARARSWEVIPRPALAFFNARPSLRLYMHPEISAEEYAERWEGPDAEMIGRFPPEDMPMIQAWLEDRGYLDGDDAPAVERFTAVLGKRKVDVRPGLMLRRKWNRRATTSRDLAAAIRDDVDAILAAASEPRLPTRLIL